MTEDTIFAPATAPGRAGVQVVRLSGPAASGVLQALTGKSLPQPRSAQLAAIRHDGQMLDQGLVIWFPGPASFTGEDVAELHLHGGRAILSSVLDALNGFPECRLAQPGEFSRRAFENGKMDLLEAEGLADLIDAETTSQRDQALRQMGGALSALYEDWRARLIKALAHLEADIDFSDEELPDGISDAVMPVVQALYDDIRAHLNDRRGERLRDGARLAIVGPPNAGKSSFLNRLAGRDAAIVSDIAGTTRDVIELHLDLNGWPVTLADTAGLRTSGDVIEEEGMARARARADDADLVIGLMAAGDAHEENWARWADKLILLENKSDEGASDRTVDARLSVRTGDGWDQALGLIEARLAVLMDQADAAAPALTRARHREALEECVAALDRFLKAQSDADPALRAEDVRLAARALGRITGRIDVEDLLDVVFNDFCLGK